MSVVVSEKESMPQVKGLHMSHQLRLIYIRSTVMMEVEGFAGNFVRGGIKVNAFSDEVFLAGPAHKEAIAEFPRRRQAVVKQNVCLRVPDVGEVAGKAEPAVCLVRG